MYSTWQSISNPEQRIGEEWITKKCSLWDGNLVKTVSLLIGTQKVKETQ